MRDVESSFWKCIKLIITTRGTYTLISHHDKKRMLLLDPRYWRFLGRGINLRRSSVSSSESKEEEDPKEETVVSNVGVDT